MGKRYYYERIGVNSRLDTIQAAVLRVKLQHLDEYSAARRKAADMYDQLLSHVDGVTVPTRVANSTHVFHQYTLKLDNADHFKVQEMMAAHGVPAMIYYPVALHTQEAYRHEGIDDSAFPVTDMLCEKVLSLPMHTELDEDQIQFIIETLKNAL